MPRAERLRVCHVITQLELGGAQQNTLYTVGHLDRRRFEVSLISGPGGILDDEAKDIDDLTFEVSPALVRRIVPIADARTLLDLWRRLRRIRPHIVHTHSSKAGVLGRTAAFLAGVPIVVHTVHGWGFTPLQTPARRRLFIGLERVCAALSSQLVSVSRANVEQGHELGIADRERFVVIRSGIRLDRYGERSLRGALRHELGLADDVPLAGMIACLKPQKAPLDYVEVASRVCESRPEAHFVLAGDGELREAVEAAVAEAGLARRFHLLGWRRDPERVVADLDVVVLTSRHEGLPRVIPEAMASSKPVVVTAVDGSPEAVRDGETGFLCEPGDIAGIAGRVAELLSDPTRAERMGRAARQLVSAWDIDAMVRDQEALYERLARAAGLAL